MSGRRRRFRARSAALRGCVAAAMSVVMTAGVVLAVEAPAGAAPRKPWRTPQHLKAVPTVDARRSRPVENVAAQLAAVATKPAEPVWPTRGRSALTLGGA